MKYIFKEFELSDYARYQFPYQVYLESEEGDSIEDIYENGFLQSRIDSRLFYLSRGIRIDVSQFELSSENRRINRKTEYLTYELSTIDKFEYDYPIGKMAIDFYKERFGEKTISAQKWKWIFTSGVFTHVIIFKDNRTNEVIGYCPIIMTKSILHYAYPFYKTNYLSENLGIGMMQSAILHSKETGIRYAYLGTCYTHNSLYKTQFKGAQWFTGEVWSDDIQGLKLTIKNQ
jgi:arginyl-tRNA--protein-N-Asp/Glu arginylyltransferase